MAILTRKAVVAVDHLAVADDARTEAGAEGNHRKVLHTACVTEYHLADSRSVGVVGNHNLNAREVLAQVGHEVEDAD